MADNTLVQMEKFDFSAPVKTIMYFESYSDEENDKPKKKRKVNKPKRVETQNTEVVSTTSKEKNVQTTETHNNSIPIYDLCEESEGDESPPGESENNQNSISEVRVEENRNNDVCKEKEADQTSLREPENTESNGDVVEKILNELQIVDNTPKSSTDATNSTNETLPVGVNEVGTTNNNELELMNFYFKKLIDTVSEHLIVILSTYHNYLRAQKTGYIELIQSWNRHYLEIKLHFFKLSYVVVDTLFLPREEKDEFSRSFIECTVMKAKKKRSTMFTYVQVEALYSELLEWTKQESKKIQEHVCCGKKKREQSKKRKNNHEQIDKNQQSAQQKNTSTTSPANESINTGETQNSVEACNQMLPPRFVSTPLNPIHLQNHSKKKNMQQSNGINSQLQKDSSSAAQQLNYNNLFYEVLPSGSNQKNAIKRLIIRRKPQNNARSKKTYAPGKQKKANPSD